ncbi:hypothetical protein FY557_17390 [Chryseobacterium sp. SN22]|uniref:hypothetical protein n=1 Tax=Chryseobacterium sp. SN22 TaxID=2606431 RepID=UPI0011EC3884|nr:hypothetical protein [Chryseobacterium sp. SN22]KAA0126424.1 hypothetical protein FY557_17390 [Chryseobacterium sp. SN22]
MNLQLSLKKKWFDMTKARVKPEDYREITPYWLKRLMFYSSHGSFTLTNSEWEEACSDIRSACQSSSDFTEHLEYHLDNWYLKFRSYTTNTMTLGYPKKGDPERTLSLEHRGIEIREGNPEWGAEPGKIYFVIKHGKII